MSSAVPVRPALAYPSFASASATFTPVVWPDFGAGGVAHHRPVAVGRLAGGGIVRQWGGLSPLRRFMVSWRGLTADEADGFAAPDGTGFYLTVGEATFEYRHTDGTLHTVRFGPGEVTISPNGKGGFDLAPVELLVEAGG